METDKPAHTRLAVVAEVDGIQNWFIAEVLRQKGYAVSCVVSGSEALLLLRSEGSVELLFIGNSLQEQLDKVALAQMVRTRWPLVQIVAEGSDLDELNFPAEVKVIPVADGMSTHDIMNHFSNPIQPISDKLLTECEATLAVIKAHIREATELRPEALVQAHAERSRLDKLSPRASDQQRLWIRAMLDEYAQLPHAL